MLITIANKYEILEKIGEGTFGKVFKGKNIRTEERVAIKIQHKDIEKVLKHEAKIYKHLKDVLGIPVIRNYGTESGFNYLILDLLGISLSDAKITSKNCIEYMIQSFNIIEQIHNNGIINRDIKPENFLFKDEYQKNICLIDFGLAKYYLTANKTHMEERKDRKLIGTAKYSSLNVHNGIEASRRDDLESLCYTFIELYGITLPWNNITNINSADELNKQELYDEIKKSKEKSLEWLLDEPIEFLLILKYCRKLEFSEKPNYKYITSTLENLLKLY
jgi:serine/threonine protein kinase